MIKFLDLYKQYQTIKSEIDKAIFSVINDCSFVNGKYAQKFEEEFALYQEAKYCIGVANGTDALEIAVESFNFPEDSEIIVPANSFIASSEAVTRAGHKVVFCDCDNKNYTISIDDVRKKITKNTVAIIVVHLYGHPCNMDELLVIAKEYNLKIIEDSAQAHGAEFSGRKIGAIGDIGAFSFYPGKNLGAFGDAGAIVTNNKSIALKCRMIANHGRIQKYDHEFEGRNSRMDGIQAAILSVKLRYLNIWIEKRRQISKIYFEKLKQCDNIILPVEEKWSKHVYHLYVIRTSHRDELVRYLQSKDIEVGIHYPVSLNKLTPYKNMEYGNMENANSFDSEYISLPIGDQLEFEEVEYVCMCILNFWSSKKNENMYN